jgi:hypothetical protein
MWQNVCAAEQGEQDVALKIGTLVSAASSHATQCAERPCDRCAPDLRDRVRTLFPVVRRHQSGRSGGGVRCHRLLARRVFYCRAAGRKELRDVPQRARHVVAVRPDISFDLVDSGRGRGTVIVVERLAPLHFG